MKEELKKILKKQHYAIIGNHSGVKLCHWMRQSLLFNRECYKQTFYGIKSHRCLQMTPSVNQCNHMCLFCWRHQGFTEKKLTSVDDPKLIVDEAIKAQRNTQDVIEALEGLRKAAQTSENVMPHILKAVRSYVTLGEITKLFKEVFGEFREPVRF